MVVLCIITCTAPSILRVYGIMYKKTYPLLAAFALFLTVGCIKDNEVKPGFDMLFREQFEIPAGLNPYVVHHFYFRNLPTRFQQILDQQGRTASQVTGVLTASGVLSGIFGDANFNFLSEVSLRAFKEPNISNQVEIGYRLPVPLEPGNRLDILPSLADVKRYAQEDRMGLDLALRLRDITRQTTTVQLDLRLRATY